jgi:endoglucanase
MDSAAVNPAASLSSGRRGLRVARVVALAFAPVVVAAGMLGTAGRDADEDADEVEFPVAHSYLRGVVDLTFHWFGGYGGYAGNQSVASYEFLAQHGVAVVRLPIIWERIQPTLGGELDQAEVARLTTEISRARAAGIDVIIDLHNSCAYKQSDGSVVACSRGISSDQFANVWTRLAARFKDTAGVLAYDLMNEPNALAGDNTETRADAVIWERFSQSAVDAVRQTGDHHQLMIEGIYWSNVDTFPDLHPRAWIKDPQDDVVYSAHQYFNLSGQYAVPGQGGFELRYSYWADKFQREGTTHGQAFDDWNLRRLNKFVRWLRRNHVHGGIGEVGWPSYEEMLATGLPAAEAADEAEHWNKLGDKWFDRADAAGLPVTYCCASGSQRRTYAGSPPGLPDPNAVFVHAGGNGELQSVHGDFILGPAHDFQPKDIDTAYSQYRVLSKHPSVS